MYPERSEQEENTSTMIQAELNRLGIPYQSNIAGYGVCATIYGKDRSRGVGVRADMDALPLTEMTDVPFKSKHPSHAWLRTRYPYGGPLRHCPHFKMS